MIIHNQHAEPWRVTVVDTGMDTMTGGRIRRVRSYLGEEPFLMTYGDGVCDVDISKLLEFHMVHGKLATLTAVRIEQQKDILNIGGANAVKSFCEKMCWMEIRLMPVMYGYKAGKRYPGENVESRIGTVEGVGVKETFICTN